VDKRNMQRSFQSASNQFRVETLKARPKIAKNSKVKDVFTPQKNTRQRTLQGGSCQSRVTVPPTFLRKSLDPSQPPEPTSNLKESDLPRKDTTDQYYFTFHKPKKEEPVSCMSKSQEPMPPVQLRHLNPDSFCVSTRQ